MQLGFNRVNFIKDIINNKFYDTKNKGGIKLLNAIINYCTKNKIDYHKYIFINLGE